MDSSSTGPRPVYLDTCVVSALVKGELSSADSRGFLTIADAVRSSDVTLWASTVVKREIDQIPPPFRQKHLDAYNALHIVRGSATTNWIDDRSASTSYGQSIVHPTFQVLTQIVPDRTDAEHLFQASMSGARDFVTTDRRTILSKATELRSRLGINVHSPAQFGTQLLSRST
jgi:hypothetical protein